MEQLAKNDVPIKLPFKAQNFVTTHNPAKGTFHEVDLIDYENNHLLRKTSWMKKIKKAFRK